MKPPIFIIGCGRSGTSLLYHTLVSSGGIAEFRTQMNVFDVLAPIYGDFRLLKNRRVMMQKWLSSKAFRLSGLEAKHIEARILAECRSAADFQRIVFQEIARVQHVDRWADSTPNNIHHIPQIKRGIPDALFIHIIRDGRNSALSIEKRGWSRPFFWERDMSLMAAGLYWKWTILRGRQYARSLGPDYIEVFYEDLVNKPREVLAKLSVFLKQDLDYDRIQRAAIGAVKNPSTSFAEELTSGQFDPLNRWKQVMSKQQIRLFESLVGDLLTELNYTLATPNGELDHGFKVKRMSVLYPAFYDLKQWVKRHTTLTRFFVDYDAILLDK
jgi:Sulfotransferase family